MKNKIQKVLKKKQNEKQRWKSEKQNSRSIKEKQNRTIAPQGFRIIYERFKNNIRHCQRSFEIVSEVTEDLQRTLQAFYEFRSHVNKIVNNMDVLEEHHQRKI